MQAIRTPTPKILAIAKPENIFRNLVCMLIFLKLACASVNAAEIGLNRQELAGTTPPITVEAVIISGQLENGDAKKVAELIDKIKQTDDSQQIRRLLIQSPGGLVGEAMEMGELLRANGFEVFIPKELSCVSACVLVLAGGATRTIVGKVGIDIPHFLRAAGPGDDVPKLLAETKTIMRNYFLAMGIAEDLADAMFALPTGVVHYLSQDELMQYRLQSNPKIGP